MKSPLPWLGVLNLLYLAVPIVAFLIRLARAQNPGFSTPGLFPSLFVSLESATISLAIITLFGVPLAYLLARSTSRLASSLGVLVMLPLALPPLMSGILLIYLVGPYTYLGRLFDGHLTMSLTGIVLAQTFCSAPFLIVASRSAFATVDPALLDVGATLGHPELSRFVRIALPIASPGIRAGMLLAWLRAFGEYGAVIVVSYHPFSLPVYTYNQFSGLGLPTTVAPTALALGVAVVVVVVLSGPRQTGKHKHRSPAVLPAPVAPAATTAKPVSFEIDHRLGTFHLALSHEAKSSRLAVLGPSGSGKSALLRCLVGLNGDSPGIVRYGHQLVSGVPTEKRRVGYVAQGFALFPHLTVWRQLLFAKGADPERAAYWLCRLRLDGLQDRFPSQLSGGQQQRVALAQALCRSPELLVLDEPFSALDSPVRYELRRELRRLQRETGLATVLVTHDPEEAAFLADEVIVISDGHALQSGDVRQTFARPGSPEVARLLGIPNLNHAVVESDSLINSDGVPIAVEAAGISAGTSVLWSIRPERVTLETASGLAGVFADVADVGTAVDLFISLSAHLEIQARTVEHAGYEIGGTCLVGLPPDAITLWPDPTVRT
jgi:ABC-type sulfate/molybdate transport systems ATPase subunit/ABC-type sulfate transport system permease component